MFTELLKPLDLTITLSGKYVQVVVNTYIKVT